MKLTAVEEIQVLSENDVRVRFVFDSSSGPSTILGGLRLQYGEWELVREIILYHQLPWYKRLFTKPRIEVKIETLGDYLRNRHQ